jgi:hypothetical protein
MLFRCSACRFVVDVGSSAAFACAGCGGALTPSESAASGTVWDDDEPPERRPVNYASRIAGDVTR